MNIPPKYEDLVFQLNELNKREAKLREELSVLEHWRDLALQFDNHRMKALWHLKTLVSDGAHYDAARNFLSEPPIQASALQQRLTVAEQRAADLKKLLCDVINEAPTGFAALKVDLANRGNDALNPADHPQCEECKGWGYHENHHEGGGTECGECGGSGNAPVAVVMPERKPSGKWVDDGSGNGSSEWHDDPGANGYNSALDEVARLNGVKP